MPKNPSHLQKVASRNNLKGHHGPKTERGKKRSAQNGNLNKGKMTAKKRAKVLSDRWKKGTNTFYQILCKNCNKNCKWFSFSPESPHHEMPLGCLEEVIDEDLTRCFYYFDGICCATLQMKQSNHTGRNPCVVDSDFLEYFRESQDESEETLANKEMGIRHLNLAMIKEMRRYLDEIRRNGLNGLELTPRKVYVIRYFQQVVQRCEPCKLSDLTSRDWDEALEWLVEGQL